MNLAAPLVLLLLPLPLILWRWWPVPERPRPALRVPAPIFARTQAGRGRQGDVAGLALAAIAWVALVMALAGPRVSQVSDMLPASGREIVLALDLSGSMVKEDFRLDGQPISRLDAVKRTATAFVQARRGDRIGLVIFGDRAYFAAPLTFDVDAVSRAIDEAQIGISGRSTAISDGLGLALKRLAGSDAPSRVVVLLSDGVNTSGDVPTISVARLAAEKGVRVHTIALGPDDLESQPRARDAVDAQTLREVAEASQGASFRVRNMADLLAMAHTLDRLEPGSSQRPPLRFWRDLWVWPAGLAALCLLILAARRPR
ncbi:VWA domain-containing protein [Paracoccus sp. M683]|uniref:VWA domain-containing protein n=1 Tax=Paracoccus sp. M683 TaxID=2594268 RepID=UPI00117F291E|nr:VWA domain-containing protein [Paracoccus sp. M683]TRW97313.1 VWA domain-containing protein [Paracoccus sp. M683]